MRIANQSTLTKQQNFTSVNLIQISKDTKEFIGLSLFQVEKKICNRVRRTTSGLPNFVFNYLEKLGLIDDKTSKYLESPLYTEIIKAYNEVTDKHWLDYLDKTLEKPAVHPPQNENYHSFYVYTKEQNDKMDEFRKNKPKEVMDLKRETIRTFAIRPTSKSEKESVLNKMKAFTLAKLNPILIQKYEEVSGGEVVHAFKINSLSELPEIFKQIDY